MLSNSDRTLFIMAVVALLLFVASVVVSHAHRLHFRDLGTLRRPGILQCGDYYVIRASNLKSPIIVYKTGRVLGLNQLHYEYVKDWSCSYQIVEEYNELP